MTARPISTMPMTTPINTGATTANSTVAAPARFGARAWLAFSDGINMETLPSKTLVDSASEPSEEGGGDQRHTLLRPRGRPAHDLDEGNNLPLAGYEILVLPSRQTLSGRCAGHPKKEK